MKYAHRIFASLTAMFLSGCGLLFVPSGRVALPPNHFREIEIRDAHTNKLLSNAIVRYEAHKEVNWARFSGKLHICPASEAKHVRRATFTLDAKQPSPGRYTFDQVGRVEWSQIAFPIGLPFGSVIKRYYGSSLIVDASGYTGIRVWGEPPLASANVRHQGTQIPQLILGPSKPLTILLPRKL